MRTLRPKDEVPVNTFVGHPWIFRDNATGDKIHVEFKEVFSAEAPDESAPTSLPRRLVNITIPGYNNNNNDNNNSNNTFLSPVKTRGYRVELVRLSVCPSVRLSVPLDIGYFVHASLG